MWFRPEIVEPFYSFEGQNQVREWDIPKCAWWRAGPKGLLALLLLRREPWSFWV